MNFVGLLYGLTLLDVLLHNIKNHTGICDTLQVTPHLISNNECFLSRQCRSCGPLIEPSPLEEIEGLTGKHWHCPTFPVRTLRVWGQGNGRLNGKGWKANEEQLEFISSNPGSLAKKATKSHVQKNWVSNADFFKKSWRRNCFSWPVWLDWWCSSRRFIEYDFYCMYGLCISRIPVAV